MGLGFVSEQRSNSLRTLEHKRTLTWHSSLRCDGGINKYPILEPGEDEAISSEGTVNVRGEEMRDMKWMKNDMEEMKKRRG